MRSSSTRPSTCPTCSRARRVLAALRSARGRRARRARQARARRVGAAHPGGRAIEPGEGNQAHRDAVRPRARRRPRDALEHRQRGAGDRPRDRELGLVFQIATRLDVVDRDRRDRSVDPRRGSRHEEIPQELPYGTSMASFGAPMQAATSSLTARRAPERSRPRSRWLARSMGMMAPPGAMPAPRPAARMPLPPPRHAAGRPMRAEPSTTTMRSRRWSRASAAPSRRRPRSPSARLAPRSRTRCVRRPAGRVAAEESRRHRARSPRPLAEAPEALADRRRWPRAGRRQRPRGPCDRREAAAGC